MLLTKFLFLTFITISDRSIVLVILPFLHAYHAVLYNSEAHSLKDPSAFGRYVIADFA